MGGASVIESPHARAPDTEVRDADQVATYRQLWSTRRSSMAQDVSKVPQREGQFRWLRGV